MPTFGGPPIQVARWPTERPLLWLNALAALGIWYLLLRALPMSAYLVVCAAVLWLMNIAFMATIRGSAVRVGDLPGDFRTS